MSHIKTGKTFYGSEALKKMQDDLKNAEGTVNDVHNKISETAKFQLQVLGGTWEKAQIKIADDFLPLIKNWLICWQSNEFPVN